MKSHRSEELDTRGHMGGPRPEHDTYYDLIRNAPFGVYLVDADFCLAQISAGCEKVFGGIDPLLNRDFAEVLRIVWPEPFATVAIDHFRHTLATGEPFHAPDTTEHRGNIDEIESYDWQIERVELPDGTFGVVCYFYDMTDRRRAEEVLRRAGQASAFRTLLTDVLLPLSDPAEMQREAVRQLVRQLRANRAFYVEVEPDGKQVVVNADYTDCEPSIRGWYDLAGYGPTLAAEYRAGHTVVIPNTLDDARVPEALRTGWEAISLLALVGVPLVKEGRLVAVLGVDQAEPRSWTDDDISLIQEAAERTGAAVERARAEQALRESEVHRNLAIEASELGSYVWHVREDRTEADARMLELFGLHDEDQMTAAYGMDRVLHPDDRELYADVVGKAIDPAGDGKLKLEFRVIHPDGSVHWVAATGHVVFEGQPRQAARIIGTAAEITERKAAEARQTFLLELADALRPLSDPAAIQGEAARVLAEQLDVGRAYYVEVDEVADVARVARDFVRGGAPSLAGEHHVTDFGWSVAILRRGECYAIADTRTSQLVPEADRPASAALQIIACIGAPLIKDGRLVGALCVTDPQPRAWSESEVDLLREMGERVWAAVERARAEAALSESEGRYRTLFNSIDEGFCVCEMVVDDDGIARDYRFLEVNPRFEEMTGLADVVGRTAYEAVPDLEADWVETYAQVALDGKVMRFDSGSEAMGRWFDVFATPVEPYGRFALVIKDVTERRLAEEALLAREEKERRISRRMELLADITVSLDMVENVNVCAKRLLDMLVPRLADEAVLAWKSDVPSGRATTVVTADGDTGLREWIEASAVGGRVPKERLDAMRDDLGVRSHAAVPLDLGAGRPGMLLLTSRASDPPEWAEEPEFAQEIAARASVALRAARVRGEEHRVALTLQEALLPDALPRDPAIEIAARYEAGSDVLEVGGDWYDAFELPDGQLAFAVGDVVGHGLEAAASMGRLRIALAALAPHTAGPAELLSFLDSFAARSSDASFATACCGLLDPASGELRYSSAGHPPMLVVEANGTTRWLDGGRSSPLLGTPTGDRAEARDVVEPGATLVAFSDGLVERRGEPITDGMSRLERAVEGIVHVSVEQACDRLVAAMGVSSRRADDVVVVCIRRALDRANSFHHVFPARPEALRSLRSQLSEWFDLQEINDRRRDDALLVINEAFSNSVEHAYDGRDADTIEVTVDHEADGSLAVAIRDFGIWRTGAPAADRGRGTDIMRSVSEDFSRTSDADGTTVTFMLRRADGGEVR